MSSLLALPPPTTSQSATGLGKLRQILASDAAAVQPIRRIPGETERQRQPDTDVETTDDALSGGNRAGGAATTTERGAKGSTAAGGFAVGSVGDQNAVSPGPVPLTTTPNAGFVAQSIHQDSLGTGLHIEPWPQAILAYQKAAGAAFGATASRLTA